MFRPRSSTPRETATSTSSSATTSSTPSRPIVGAPTSWGPATTAAPLSFPALADTFYRNRGDGTFENATHQAGFAATRGAALGAVAADFDGDGRHDLYVGNDGTPNRLWLQGPDGTFRDEAVTAGAAVNSHGHAEASMGIALADLDHDGDEDLVITHLTGETNTVYRNDGGAQWSDVSTRSGLGAPSWDATGFGTAVLDFDGDGNLDLFTANGAVKTIKELVLAGDGFPLHQRNQLFRGRGDGTFAEVSSTAGPAFAHSEVSRGVAVGDVDDDGDLDLLVANNGGPARLLLNHGPPGSPWLGLRLLPLGLERDAIGARAELRMASGTVRTGRVTTTGSYASSSDPRVLFSGLIDEPEALWVSWPSGRRERFDVPPRDLYSVLREGTGTDPAAEGSR